LSDLVLTYFIYCTKAAFPARRCRSDGYQFGQTISWAGI